MSIGGDWRETLQGFADDINSGAPRTTDDFKSELWTRVEDSLNSDMTFVGVAALNIEQEIERLGDAR